MEASAMSGEWDAVYAAGGQDVRWPWSDLVAYVKRHARPGFWDSVLELGPGTGANVPFFQAHGMYYCGVEASKTAIDILRKRFPRASFEEADFTEWLPADTFDLVVDRASLPHNTMPAIGRCLSMAHARLIQGGWFIGVDWFSEDDTYPERFKDLGTVTRFNHDTLMALFPKDRWIVAAWEHVIRKRHDGKTVATWNIAARRL